MTFREDAMYLSQTKNVFLFCACLNLVTFGGCANKTPLIRLLKEDAPNFQPKAPATNDAELGRDIIGKLPAINPSFAGELEPSLFRSWSNRVLTYNHAHDADVSADFGDIFRVTADESTKVKVYIKLSNVQEQRLKNLFYNPSVGSEFDIGGKIERRVITRALKADSVYIKKETVSGMGLAIDTTKVSGKLKTNSDGTSIWAGDNLFFGHVIEKVQVTSTSINRELATGQACTLSSCSFVLDAIDHNLWNGTLSCQGSGDNNDSYNLRGKVGSFINQRVGPGVSYSIQIQKVPGIGRAQVLMYRYVTTTIK